MERTNERPAGLRCRSFALRWHPAAHVLRYLSICAWAFIRCCCRGRAVLEREQFVPAIVSYRLTVSIRHGVVCFAPPVCSPAAPPRQPIAASYWSSTMTSSLTVGFCRLKAAFHDADADIVARILADSPDTPTSSQRCRRVGRVGVGSSRGHRCRCRGMRP